MRIRIITAILACLTSFQAFAQADTDISLIARNMGTKVLSSGHSIRIFGFAEQVGDNPGVPGPTITVNEGDSVHIDLWNISQGAPHTMHLHGLDVNQQNDGVPHLSFDIHHMEHGFYHFKAPHAGTYLYHCHVASTIHVQAGMYGLIVVRPPDGSNTTWAGGHSFDVEGRYFLSEIDTFWHKNSVLDHPHDTSAAVHPVSIPKFEPQYFLINGFSDQQLAEEGIALNSAVGAVNYLRFANIGYCGNRIVFPSQLNAVIVDSDGRPLSPEEVSDTLTVYPGERYGVLCEAMEEFSDQISIEYVDMNTMQILNTQLVPVNVSGYFGVSEAQLQAVQFSALPNPFRDELTLQFNLPTAAKVAVTLLNAKGQVVHSLAGKQLQGGTHQLQLNTETIGSGIYFVQLQVNGKTAGIAKVVKP